MWRFKSEENFEVKKNEQKNKRIRKKMKFTLIQLKTGGSYYVLSSKYLRENDESYFFKLKGG